MSYSPPEVMKVDVVVVAVKGGHDCCATQTCAHNPSMCLFAAMKVCKSQQIRNDQNNKWHRELMQKHATHPISIRSKKNVFHLTHLVVNGLQSTLLT